jgi:hypothetical protein
MLKLDFTEFFTMKEESCPGASIMTCDDMGNNKSSSIPDSGTKNK